MVQNHSRLPIVVWTSVFLAQAIVYLALIPVWQAPDEPTSFELLLTMSAKNRLVTPDDAIPAVQREIIDSMERNRFWELGGYGGRPLREEDRNFRAIWSCCYTQLNRPPLYQAVLLPAAKLTASLPIEWRLRLLRFLTVLMGALTVVVVAKIACELVELHPAIPWILPAFVALSPQFTYSTATFNADNLAALLGALLFWRLLRPLRYGITIRSLIELAVLLALGFITKRTILLTIPAIIFALAWQAISDFRGRKERRPARESFAVAGGLAVLCLLVAVVPALRTAITSLVWRFVFIDAPEKYFTTLRQVADQHLAIKYWLFQNVTFLNLSFWGSYGWHQFHISFLIANLLLGLLVVSWLSAFVWLWWARLTLPAWGVRFLWTSVVGGLAAILLTMIGTPPEVMPQGRYLFPVLVPIFVVTTIGLGGWWRTHWPRLAWAIMCGLVILDLYSIFAVVIPAYRR